MKTNCNEVIWLFMNKFYFLSQQQFDIMSKFVPYQIDLNKYTNPRKVDNEVYKIYYNNITLGVNSLVSGSQGIRIISYILISLVFTLL